MSTTIADPSRFSERREQGARRRRWVLLDAVASGAFGLVLAPFSWALDEPLGVPAVVLVAIGLFCLVYATALSVLASRGAPARAAAAVGYCNLGWVVASVGVVVADVLTLTTAGTVVAALQAAVVAVLAELQLHDSRLRSQSESNVAG